jgi:hypothetical protein
LNRLHDRRSIEAGVLGEDLSTYRVEFGVGADNTVPVDADRRANDVSKRVHARVQVDIDGRPAGLHRTTHATEFIEYGLPAHAIRIERIGGRAKHWMREHLRGVAEIVPDLPLKNAFLGIVLREGEIFGDIPARPGGTSRGKLYS